MREILLASNSPRRRELIQLLGCPVGFLVADVNEASVTNPDPRQNVVETARLKADAIVRDMAGETVQAATLIVAADTTVSLDGRMLGKPVDESEAWVMLRSLRGRNHDVHTGIALVDLATGRYVTGSHTALVTMRNYGDEEIAAYIATGDPMDKAGAYAIQHPTFQPVQQLSGCFTGVMGLSVCHMLLMLESLPLAMQVDMEALLKAHQGYYCDVYQELAATE